MYKHRIVTASYASTQVGHRMPGSLSNTVLGVAVLLDEMGIGIRGPRRVAPPYKSPTHTVRSRPAQAIW